MKLSNSIEKKIEQILFQSTISLGVDTIEKQLSDSNESLNEILSVIRNSPKIFRIEPNGKISLRYDETFREVVKTIDNQLKLWGKPSESEILVLLFLFKIRSSRTLASKLSISSIIVERAELKNYIFLTLRFLNSENKIFKKTFDDILDKWKPNWPWNNFEPLLGLINKIPDVLFGRYFSDYTRVIGYKEWGTFNEPNSTTGVLVAKLAAQYKPKSIYDPFAGMGHFAIELHKLLPKTSLRLHGKEPSIVRLGKINLLLNGITNFEFICTDSLSDDRKAFQVDTIVTNPPFGLNIQNSLLENQSENSIFRKDRSFTTHAILSSLEHLSENGNMFMFVPETFLFHEMQIIIREYLIKNKLLKAVYSLPADLLKPYSRVKMSILHISKDKHNNNEAVSFIESDFLSAYLKGDDVELLENINQFTTSLSYTKIFEGLNYELVVGRYKGLNNLSNNAKLIKDIIVGEGVMGVILKNNSIITTQGTPVVRIKDLRNAKDAIRITNDSLRKYDIAGNGKTFQSIPKNSILFPRFGEQITPKIFSGNEGCTYDKSSLFCLKFDNSKVLPEYIIYQFEQESIKEQVKNFSSGTTIPFITLAGLNRIRLEIPSLEEQQRIVQQWQETSIKEVRVEQEGIEYEWFSSLQHSMSQPLIALETDLSTLFQYLTEKSDNSQPISMQDYIAPLLHESQKKNWEGKRLKVVKGRIEGTLQDLRSSFSKIETMIKVNTPLDLEKCSLKSLWEKALDKNSASVYYKYEVTGDCEMLANKGLLNFCFGYLIENAIKHGFKDRDMNLNQIWVDIKPLLEANQVVMWYRNNGNPFPESFNLEHIFEKGRTTDKRSGSGFGGFLIHQIIQKHRGTIVPLSNPQDPYPVQFQITLPIDHD